MNGAIEVIPPLALDEPKLHSALQELDETHAKVEGLRNRAKDIKVSTAEERTEAAQIITDIKSLAKVAESPLAPFEAVARKVTDFLRGRRLRTVNLCEETRLILNPKMQAYDKREEQATAKEQAKENKQAEKRGEEPGQVQPNIPQVAGNVKRVNWRARIKNAQKIPLRWLVPDLQAINGYVREVMASGAAENESTAEKLARWNRNKARLEKEISGIEVYEERTY